MARALFPRVARNRKSACFKKKHRKSQLVHSFHPRLKEELFFRFDLMLPSQPLGFVQTYGLLCFSIRAIAAAPVTSTTFFLVNGFSCTIGLSAEERQRWADRVRAACAPRLVVLGAVCFCHVAFQVASCDTVHSNSPDSQPTPAIGATSVLRTTTTGAEQHVRSRLSITALQSLKRHYFLLMNSSVPAG